MFWTGIQQDLDVILVVCGGHRVHPKWIFGVQLEVCGCIVTIPTLVVSGQVDELIIGTNVIKYLIHKFKDPSVYWKLIFKATDTDKKGGDDFLAMLAGIH